MIFCSVLFQYKDIRPVHDDILIAKLRPGQVSGTLLTYDHDSDFDFDFVLFLFFISIHLLADSSPLFILFIHLFLLYVVRHVWG